MSGMAQRLNTATQNPMFGAGMGLLSSGDIGGVLGGIDWTRANAAQAQEEERRRRLREAIMAGQSQVPNSPVAMGDPWFSPPVGGKAAVGASFGGSPPAATPPIIDPGSLDPKFAAVADAVMQYGTTEDMLSLAQFMQARKDKEAERDWRTQLKMLTGGSDIGKYNPRDYTADSFARFVRTKNPADLERYEPFVVVDVGGVNKIMDRSTGQIIGDVGGGLDEVTSNVGAIRAAEDTAAADVKLSKEAQAALNSMLAQQQQLEKLMNDENFAKAVGPLDAIMGKVGEKMGTEAGVLGRNAEQIANKLVVGVSEAWKGAISNRELDLFRQTVPQRSDREEVWKKWYESIFLPTLEDYRRRAPYGKWTPGLSSPSGSDIDELLRKYGG